LPVLKQIREAENEHRISHADIEFANGVLFQRKEPGCSQLISNEHINDLIDRIYDIAQKKAWKSPLVIQLQRLQKTLSLVLISARSSLGVSAF